MPGRKIITVNNSPNSPHQVVVPTFSSNIRHLSSPSSTLICKIPLNPSGFTTPALVQCYRFDASVTEFSAFRWCYIFSDVITQFHLILLNTASSRPNFISFGHVWKTSRLIWKQFTIRMLSSDQFIGLIVHFSGYTKPDLNIYSKNDTWISEYITNIQTQHQHDTCSKTSLIVNKY